MNVIFDTGASISSISLTEANFLLKQCTLDKEDLIGLSQFSDANGTISEGILKNLKSVSIGVQIINNVRASVVANEYVPLLLDQSALSQFGKFTIHYKNGIITFQK